MRQKFKQQTQNISEIEIPTNSRNRIYPALITMQEIYKRKRSVIDSVYSDLLKEYSNTTNDVIEPTLSDFFPDSEDYPQENFKNLGASGMTAWQTFVAVTLRQLLNFTYDDLEFSFNHNNLVREFLELPSCDHELFSQSRLGKNCRKVSPETIQVINDAVIDLSIEMGFEDGKDIRSDSFACKTNIHHPSDTKAIEDGCNKILQLCVSLTKGEDGWRQYEDWRKKIKSLVRELIQCKKSRKKNKVLKNFKIKNAYKKLIKKARQLLKKGFDTWEADLTNITEKTDLSYYMCCLEMILDLTERRIIKNEDIQKSEKIFSIFESHTELIHRGKFPIPIEYGHRVVVSEGKSGMILDHKVMENGVLDQEEYIPLLKRLKERYGKLRTISLDKGYNSKGLKNIDLSEYVESQILPSKGYKNKAVKEHESTPSFIKLRMWRAGVESCIGTLMQAHGADKCRDKCYRGFRRWVSACVLSRNLVTLGRLILEQRSDQKVA